MWPIIQQFIVVVFGSGAAIAIANFLYQQRRDVQARNDATAYLAIQLAFQLEGYVIRCANAASDNDTAISSNGAAGKYIGSIPALDPLPESSAYQYLSSPVLSAVLDLPQRRDMAQEAGMFYWDMLGDENATHGAMEEHTLRMAVAALAAADLIRAAYPIGSRTLKFGEWDLRAYLDKEMKAIQKRHDQNARHLQEMARVAWAFSHRPAASRGMSKRAWRSSVSITSRACGGMCMTWPETASRV
jgi:hypothetical protein